MNFCIKVDPITGQQYMAVAEKGKSLLLDPFTNKGTAFSMRERRELDLEGLLPPARSSLQMQLDRCYENYQAKSANLERFIYLASLHDRCETLFYRLVHEHIDEMMPVVYTPVVGEACEKFSNIFRGARGLYISYEQRNDIESVLRNNPCQNPSVIVCTDGERILGLGDQGAGGMGIPIGKLCLYTLCAGVSPYNTLPIMLDVGTNNQDRLNDPLYIGLKRKRVTSDEYQEFIDRFVAAVMKVFPNALLQWEDFLKGNAIKQLKRFRNKLCTFNDDIQGTAGVVVAGLYSGLKIIGQKMSDQRVLFAGAGASAQGISDLIVSAMLQEELSLEEARKNIWTVDSRGLVTKKRSKLEDFKATYARDVQEVDAYNCADKEKITLEEAVRNAKPTILIGTSGTPNMFTEPIIKAMGEFNDRPIIFPLSNPTSKSECTPKQAIEGTGGRAIVATGSPFDPVDYAGKTYRIGQGNNAFIFPGVGLGATISRASRITNGMFLEAAKALADKVTTEDLEVGAVYPILPRIRECSHAVACAVIKRAVQEGHADGEILENLEETVERAMWIPKYIPIRYEPSQY